MKFVSNFFYFFLLQPRLLLSFFISSVDENLHPVPRPGVSLEHGLAPRPFGVARHHPRQRLDVEHPGHLRHDRAEAADEPGRDARLELDGAGPLVEDLDAQEVDALHRRR